MSALLRTPRAPFRCSITTLIPSTVSTNCLRWSHPSSFFSSHCDPFALRRVAVIGSGLMGSGVAQVMAQAGIAVSLYGQSDHLLDQARSNMITSLSRIAKKRFPEPDAASIEARNNWVHQCLANISMSSHLESHILTNQPDLVIEAIVENLDDKRQLFKRLENLVQSPLCLFASNTSSLKIADIATALAPLSQSRFAGLHFFNPVPQMKLVEVIRCPDTGQETVDQLSSLCQKIGKTPVHSKDSPGFIVNRLLVPFLLEAIRMLQRGDASAEDIDTAIKLGAGHPMGPIALADYIGLDTLKSISDGWRQSRVSSGEMEEQLVAPVESLDSLVRDGKLGLKSNQGFYNYHKD